MIYIENIIVKERATRESPSVSEANERSEQCFALRHQKEEEYFPRQEEATAASNV